MNIDIQIEKMQEKHIKEISEIENICFSQPWSTEGLRYELDNKTALFLVALNSNEVLGYIGSHIILNECYITNIAVLPKYRKKSVGRTLISNLIKIAEKQNCSFISLEVRESNTPAINLYESMNFKNMGKRKGFYNKPNEDAIIMTLKLKEGE